MHMAFSRHFLVLIQNTVLVQDTLDFWLPLLPKVNYLVWETFCWLDWYPCTWYSQCDNAQVRVRTDWLSQRWITHRVHRWIGWLSEWPPLIASWRLAVQGDGKSAGICRLQLTANHAPGRRWKSHQKLNFNLDLAWRQWLIQLCVRMCPPSHTHKSKNLCACCSKTKQLH